MTTSPIPFRADANARREANVTSIVRGLRAYARARDLRDAIEAVKDDRGAVAFLQRSDDRLVHRAATTPASMATITAFSQNVVDSMVDILGADNAAAVVFSRAGAKATFGREASIWIPGIGYDGSKANWVAQGNPIRVGQFDLSQGVTLNAGLKMAYSIVVSRELLAHSNCEGILRLKVAEDIGAALEATLFGSADAVANQQPAGLLHDAQTVTAESTATGTDALVVDLGGLAAAVGATGGEIIYIGNIKEVTRIRARLPLFGNVYASGAVAAGNLIAIAPRGIAVAGNAEGPRIDTSAEAVLVLDDALTDQQISAEGSPPTIMAPVRSLFQSDCIAIKLLLPDLCWGQRVAAGTGGCVAALTGTIKW